MYWISRILSWSRPLAQHSVDHRCSRTNATLNAHRALHYPAITPAAPISPESDRSQSATDSECSTRCRSDMSSAPAPSILGPGDPTRSPVPPPVQRLSSSASTSCLPDTLSPNTEPRSRSSLPSLDTFAELIGSLTFDDFLHKRLGMKYCARVESLSSDDL